MNSWPSINCKLQIASSTARRQVGDVITEKWKILDIFLRDKLKKKQCAWEYLIIGSDIFLYLF